MIARAVLIIVAEAASAQPIGGDSSAGHLSLGLNHRADAQFNFSIRPRRTAAALGVSLLLQSVALVALYFAGRSGLRVIGVISPQPHESMTVNLVYLPQPGPGGGGGGGGNRLPAPPRKAEAKGDDGTTVPVAPTPALEANVEPPPLARLDIPVQSMSQGLQDSLGAVQGIGPPTISRGPGDGDGTGSGKGKGDGPGDGVGLGPGKDRGIGGDQYGPGSGATDPIVTVRVDPQYTPEAMLARVHGSVWVSCTVRPNGLCTDARVTRAPDPAFGLDRAALDAVGKWRFVPAKKNNQPVSMTVSIELEFSVR